MLKLSDLKIFLQYTELKQSIDEVWDSVGISFLREQDNLPLEKAMTRKEISFHDQVKFLGYLCWLISDVSGDIIEIGVWKGKSASFMNQMCQRSRRIIAIDPMALPNQASELEFYHERLFPEVVLIRGFSEMSIERVLALKPKTLILHIDGGHQGRNVLLDFLLYAPTVVSGGFIVFDDYRDYQYSPDVGPAIDLLRAGGYFNKFDVIGSVPGYENSYLLKKK
ncbi:class I SAM-dependent methyltransferase [Brenneria goodwinii]|uniref:class I SAM-dependent methyltransferase n=1 Tax=Brenneria goodwinii TaxID=1109412 RepID=UPI0036DFF884